MREQGRAFRAILGVATLASYMFMPICLGSAQTSSAGYVPPPSPGYGLFFHDTDSSPNVTTRWGYRDGWEDGRHDRNHGEPVEDSKKKDRYTSPPEHGGYPALTREEYMRSYRAAYLHGYEHGSRL